MIKLQSLSFAYENTNEAMGQLRKIDLHVKKGELIILSGKSGCGKTTLTRVLNGLCPAFYPGKLEGGYFLDGEDALKMPIHQIGTMVGSVFQDPRSQFFATNTTDEIVLGMENVPLERPTMQKRIDAVCRQMNIERLLDRRIFPLSSGEKKLVAIASVCAMEPKVIVLDEPSANLDSEAMVHLGTLLYRLKAAGHAMKMTDTVVGAYIHVAAMLLCLSFFCWQAALTALCGVVLSGLFLRLLSWFSHKNAAVHQEAQNRMITSVIEFIRGIAVVKAYGQGGAAVGGIRKAFEDHRKINIKIGLDYVWVNGLHQLSLKLASVGVVLVSAILTIQGSLSLPIFLMMAIFSFVLFAQVEQVQNGAHTMELMNTAMNKIEAIEQAEFIDRDAKPVSLSTYDIDFEDVSFGYDQRRVLDGISFHIPQGSTAAIVGPSGSGKTTICNLLARFYDVDGGSVRIGGQDVREMTCDSLLSNISMVFQNVYLSMTPS